MHFNLLFLTDFGIVIKYQKATSMITLINRTLTTNQFISQQKKKNTIYLHSTV